MFCPECRSEYRAGFTECSECHLRLVEVLPESAETGGEPNARIVTVYRTSDSALVSVARSLLESAGIVYEAKGDNLGDLFAVGRIANSFNPVVGPVEFQVEEKDATEAEALLKDLEANVQPVADDEMTEVVGECEIRAERTSDADAIAYVHSHA